MANTVYANFVLEDKVNDLLSTAVNTRSLMTIDTSLAENAGMKKTINTYTYTGSAEAVAERNGNTSTGSVAYVGKDYTVAMLQQKADYTDEDIMKDGNVLDVLMKGATQVMANKLTADFYAALAADINIGSTSGAFGYEHIVDAIANMNVEDESALFLLINPAQKATIRKDADYKTAAMGEVIYNGMVGTIAGIPVIVSKAVPTDVAYLLTKEAATCFMKKDVEVEQDRDADKRINNVYLRTAYIVAITDATKAQKLVKVQENETPSGGNDTPAEGDDTPAGEEGN